jgi:DNA-binding FadR family transcriptional regulator
VYVSDTAQYQAFQISPAELSELDDVIKLLEMRLAVETETAGLAAARRTTADISAIQQALQEMIDREGDPVAAAKADRAFHLAIARATQNDYFVRFGDFLGLRLVPPRNLYLRNQPESVHAAYTSKVHAEHQAILEAIVRMDSVSAREAARHHMRESLTRHSMLSMAARLRDPSS